MVDGWLVVGGWLAVINNESSTMNNEQSTINY
jgi:hypothetical protein